MKRKITILFLLCLALLPQAGRAGAKLEKRYSEDGRLIAEEYRAEDGGLAVGAKGFARHELEYDAAGNAVWEAWFDAQLNPMPNRDGVTALTREYDDDGRVGAIWYYDGADAPAMNPKLGAFGESFEYNSHGKVVVDCRLDAEGRPMAGAQGWAVARYCYDGEDRRISERYFDADGAPCLRDGSYWGLDRAYGDDGGLRETYYNIKGEIAPNASGVTVRETDYDADGNVLRRRYFDAEGRPCALKSKGCFAERFEYDDQGRRILAACLDARGDPMPGKQGWAYAIYFYDAAGGRILERYYDERGMAASVRGFQQRAMVRDASGALLAETYLDAEGNRVACDDDYATAAYTYDARGGVLETAYFDADGAPVACVKGYARIVTERDAAGKVLRERYYGVDGKPAKLREGYCAIARTYDGAGRVLSIEYLDADGKPARCAGRNYAMITYDYDARGNRVSARWFDRGHRPVASGQGASAATLWEYDGQGRVISERYYDASGQPMYNRAHYAGYTARYSRDGTVQTLTYIRPSGEPVKPTASLPYVKLRRTYDAPGGLLIREEYLDAQGRPTRNRERVYGRAHEYDALGREVKRYTFGADGRVTGGRSAAAVTEYTYDASGARTAQRFTASGRRVG